MALAQRYFFGMGRLTGIIIFLFCFSVQASWYFNENAGFGFYQPDSWTLIENGRSSRLLGPEKDVKRSELFMGSDWIIGVNTLSDLAAYLKKEFKASDLQPVRFSELDGFAFKLRKKTEIYLLRKAENIIVIEYILQGSDAQISEGEVVISSIEIKTKPLLPSFAK